MAQRDAGRNDTGPVAAVLDAPDPLAEATIPDLADAMAAGTLTAVELTEYYLDRIDRLNTRGPELRAVLETNPDALAIAGALDRERRGGRVRGRLHGIPVLLKDNLDTADRMHTTGGSTALLGARPLRDATVAARLRAAGAVLLGKTNLTGWITGSSGWSARGGQCRNPYKLDRTPHGSSAGSAVAVAADLCAAALGAETVGSILAPSSVNCVVGVKPTVGLTSRAGMIPGVPSMDTVGPICRTVADAAILLGALTGVDPRDPATAASAPHRRRDYAAFLDSDGLRGARIGVPRRGYFGDNDHADAIAESAIEVLAAAGAVIVDNADIPTMAELTAHAEVLATVQFREAKAHKNAYFADTPGEHPRSIAELIAFNRAHADTELRYFGQQGLEMVQAFSDDLADPAYRDALATMHRITRDEGIDATLRAHDLDALVLATVPPPWKIDLVNGDPPITGSAVAPGLAGYPAVNVPAGFVHGLPVGVTFTGTAWSEPTLIRLAHAFERANPVRRVPTFDPPDVGR